MDRYIYLKCCISAERMQDVIACIEQIQNAERHEAYIGQVFEVTYLLLNFRVQITFKK